jgi:hypothetical protein
LISGCKNELRQAILYKPKPPESQGSVLGKGSLLVRAEVPCFSAGQ